MNSIFNKLISDGYQQSRFSFEQGLSCELENLLNHTRDADDSLKDDILSNSHLFYGLPSLAGKQINSDFLIDIGEQIRLTILRFEPRLENVSVSVPSKNYRFNEPGVLHFSISAILAIEKKELALDVNYDMHFGRNTISNLIIED
jgi:predicted component of type VI protein secretion system